MENVGQSFDLYLVLRQYPRRITALRRGYYVVGQHLEVLVECRLRRLAKFDCRVGAALFEIVFQRDYAHPLHVPQKRIARAEVAVYGRRFVELREQLLAYFVDLAQRMIGIGKPYRTLRDECRQRDALLVCIVHVGYDLHRVGTL